ncbi:helix-turn-helix domain-containing protein [Streptomyces sp. NPDC047072]|uniref:helix-turn-helix domain-containing protein n=1 Tax=Streptomyces sp. NPDC047072 TaxID=3154809 RepID=UPI0033FB9CE7
MTLVSHVSTRSVDREDRIAFWEEYNRRALVGLTCSSYSPDGLLAAQTNHRLGGLRLAGISGNEHVIERTPRACRELPKDSVFVSLLTAGQAVFFHEGGCLTLRAGDAVLYDTRGPYLFGFPSAMRKLLVDIPRETFAERCVPGDLRTPLLFERGATGLKTPGTPGTRGVPGAPGAPGVPGVPRVPGAPKALAPPGASPTLAAPMALAALESVLTRWTTGHTDAHPTHIDAHPIHTDAHPIRTGDDPAPTADDPAATEATVLDLIRTLIAPRTGDDRTPTAGPATAPARLALAHHYIDRHLTDPRLALDRVAEALGVSTRHLGRLFAPSGTTPARHILDRRLTQAYDQLTDPAGRGRTVAEIAHHWGFASQAHFTRVFRARYGRTPGETRPHPRAGDPGVRGI